MKVKCWIYHRYNNIVLYDYVVYQSLLLCPIYICMYNIQHVECLILVSLYIIGPE